MFQVSGSRYLVCRFQVSGARYQVCRFQVPTLKFQRSAKFYVGNLLYIPISANKYFWLSDNITWKAFLLSQLWWTKSFCKLVAPQTFFSFYRPEYAVNLPMPKWCSCRNCTLAWVFVTDFQNNFWKEHLQNVMTLALTESTDIWHK